MTLPFVATVHGRAPDRSVAFAPAFVRCWPGVEISSTRFQVRRGPRSAPGLAGVLVAFVAFGLAACGGGPEVGSSSSGTSSGHGVAASTGVSPQTSAQASSGAGNGGSGGAPAGSGGGACPADMATVGPFCMDRYEAPNQAGQDPLVMESAVTAAAWCAARGKRLCTEDEWDTACEGPQKTTYPYGDTHVASRCNDDKIWKVVDEAALNTWPSAAAQAEEKKLWQGAPSGSYPECVSSFGVFDLTGNIEEWVVRSQPHVNDYPHVLKGCYWAGCYGGAKPRCGSTNPAHADGFLFYETGFRCCKDGG